MQLQCAGTLLETRGSAELKRDTRRLAVSLGLEAEAADADGALAALQRRLAAVRQRLVALRVQELRVSSPSTWQRPQEPGRAGPRVVASLQVSGQLAPERLQAFVREVGGLEGVRLNPVAAEADPAAMPAVRARLLRLAYQDALAQARELAGVVGRASLQPLDVRVEGHDLRPVAMRAMAADAAPFDPAELPQPTDRLALQVRFCAS
ncbi:MAG: SIMPL domain-containing protein [Chitinophagaceae bacterium]|nr:SIMPL domain-containing protein [Chitinophagaceae bacterium]